MIGRWRFRAVFIGLFALFIFLFFFFAATKGNFPYLKNWLSPLSTVGYHAPWIIFLILLVSTGITAGSILPALQNNIGPRKTWRTAFPIIVLFFTMFPIGNWIKHHTLFYENWMWYCALWTIGVYTSAVSIVYLMGDRNTLCSRFGRRILLLDAFFSRTQSTNADRWLVAFVGAWIFIATLTANAWVFGSTPHVYDELAQLFQAKVFAHGRLVAATPAAPQFFERMYVPIEGERWYSIYPPGHALLLALGVLAGHPNWINPLISALIVPLFFLFARRTASLFTARLGVALAALSPFFLLMGSGYMNHPSCLLFLLLYLLFWDKALTDSRSRNAAIFSILAGVCGGFSFLIRPLTAMAFWGAGLFWAIARSRYQKSKTAFLSLLFIIALIPSILFFLTFNERTTGSPWITGYQHYFDGNPLGFGEKPWGENPLGPKIPRGEYHTPLRGAANTLCNLNALNSYLFGWPVPSLLFAALLFLPGFKRTRTDAFCLIAIASVCIVYFFYFFQDVCYGPRFLYETIPFWILLTARGIEEIRRHWGDAALFPSPKIQGLIYGFLLTYFSVAAITSWPERIVQYKNDYWGTRAELAQTLRKGIPERDAIVFVEDANDHFSVFSFLDPALDRGWIVAHDLGDRENQTLLKDYPEWPVYKLRLKEDVATGEIQTVLERCERS